jgi:hypothetical protein
MIGETDLNKILKSLKPKLNSGDFVFCVIDDLAQISQADIISTFKEEEGVTVIIKKELADQLKLKYSFVAAWITLTVHSSLEAVGLTSAFSAALSNERISCNVVAAFHHDHIFVNKNDAEKAVDILNSLSH